MKGKLGQLKMFYSISSSKPPNVTKRVTSTVLPLLLGGGIRRRQVIKVVLGDTSHHIASPTSMKSPKDFTKDRL